MFRYIILINYNTRIFTMPIGDFSHTLLPHCKYISKADNYQKIISILSLTFYVNIAFPLGIHILGRIPNFSLTQLESNPFLVILFCFMSLIICHCRKKWSSFLSFLASHKVHSYVVLPQPPPPHCHFSLEMFPLIWKREQDGRKDAHLALAPVLWVKLKLESRFKVYMRKASLAYLANP